MVRKTTPVSPRATQSPFGASCVCPAEVSEQSAICIREGVSSYRSTNGTADSPATCTCWQRL